MKKIIILEDHLAMFSFLNRIKAKHVGKYWLVDTDYLSENDKVFFNLRIKYGYLAEVKK